MADPQVIIEVVGEGKTDIGEVGSKISTCEPPDEGIIPVLIHRLCKQPPSMRILRKKWSQLERNNLTRKVWFEKLQAAKSRCAGIVFAIDTEGEKPAKKLEELRSGSSKTSPDFPTALCVAHPCIEAWLLADPDAIARGLKLTDPPSGLPPDPEGLPAPQKEGKQHPKNCKNPKIALGRCAGSDSPLPTKHTTAIARHLDISRIETVCPIGFKPFADEVRANLLPLFTTNEKIE